MRPTGFEYCVVSNYRNEPRVPCHGTRCGVGRKKKIGDGSGCRLSLKEKRGEAGFLTGKRILEVFHKREGQGNLMFSTLTRAVLVPVPVCPTLGSTRTKPCVYPANVPGRTNVVGFLSGTMKPFPHGRGLGHPSGDHGGDERFPPLAQP